MSAAARAIIPDRWHNRATRPPAIASARTISTATQPGGLAMSEITQITHAHRRAFANHAPSRSAYAARKYACEIRRHRIDRLVAFLAAAVTMARLSPDPSWHSRHAIWAIQKLEHLNYSFPEVADPVSEIRGRMAA